MKWLIAISLLVLLWTIPSEAAVEEWWLDTVLSVSHVDQTTLLAVGGEWSAWQLWDQRTLDWIRAGTISEANWFWSALSTVGDPKVHAALSATAFLLNGENDSAYGKTIGLTGMVVGLGKTLFGQARPHVGQGPTFQGPTLDSNFAAMPSAHAAVNFAAAAHFSRRYPDFAPIIWGGAGLVSFSRLILEEHWPSNVLLGALLGVFFGNLLAAEGP